MTSKEHKEKLIRETLEGANEKRILMCLAFCSGFTNDQLAEKGSLKEALEKEFERGNEIGTYAGMGEHG